MGGCLAVPQGACFLSLPRPAPVSSLTQDQTSPLPSIPPSLLPSGSTIGSPFALLDQSPRHRQCLSSVHNICSRSLYAPLGKSLSIPDGALSNRHGFGSLSSHCHWDRTLESNYSANWHLLIPLSAKSQHPHTPVFFFLPLRKALPKRSEEKKKKTCLHFDLEPQFQHHIKLYARSKNINLIILRLDSWPQAGGRNANTEGEYQMWSLWLGHSSPKHRPGRSIERRTMMVWWRATADDENSGQSVI